MKRLSLHEWIPMLPWPVCPLAGHAKFGQNVVVGSMLVLRVALRNVPRGVCLDPHFHCKRTIPRLSVELPVYLQRTDNGRPGVQDAGRYHAMRWNVNDFKGITKGIETPLLNPVECGNNAKSGSANAQTFGQTCQYA